MKISKNFSPNKNWMTSTVKFGSTFNLNRNSDFLIIPEIWAHFAEDIN